MPQNIESLRAAPMAPPAIAVGAGVLLADNLPLPFWLWTLIALMALAGSLSASARTSWLCLLLALLSSAAAKQMLDTTPWSAADLRHLKLSTPELCTVTGVIDGDPMAHSQVSRGKVRVHTTLQIIVHGISSPDGGVEPATGRINAFVRGALDAEFQAGARIEVSGALRRPEESTVPGSFNYRAWLERSGIWCELAQTSPSDWKVIARPDNESSGRRSSLQKWGRNALSHGLPVEDTALRLIWAMALGWKPGLDRDLADPFVQSGTLHVFAISGLHIALIAWIAVEGFRAAGLRRRWAGLTALPLLWTYAWVTGAQPSAIRSAVMMTVVTIGWALERPGNAANSLCGAAVILLLWDPQQLFQPGFQLSFCVVLCLSTLSPRIHTLLEQWFQRPLLTPTPSVWRERLGFFQRWLIGSFSVSLAAWLGSLPLIAAYFHIVNPVSLVANLIVVPLSSICLAGCAGSLLVYPFAPVLSDLFNHGSWFWMRLMMICSDWAAGIPGAWFHAPEPGWVAMALWWAGLALCWLWPKISPITRRYVSTSIACGWLGVFASFVWDSMPTRLSLVPRRTGATLVVDPPGWGGVTLLDPGDIWFSPRVLVPFLRSRGINRIENLVITHASAGAITGASSLEKPFWVGSRHGPDGNYRSPAWRDWVKPQPGLVAHPRLHSSGQKLSSWEVLHPPRLAGSRVADDASLVLRGDFSGVRILWIPPLSAKGQNELLRSGLDLTADIVIAQLPGRGEALLDPLLDAIQPGSIIIGDGKDIQSFSRVAALKHRLGRRPVDLFFTSESGFLEILIRSRSFKILASRKTTLPEGTSWDGAEPNEER